MISAVKRQPRLTPEQVLEGVKSYLGQLKIWVDTETKGAMAALVDPNAPDKQDYANNLAAFISKAEVIDNVLEYIEMRERA